MGLESSKGDYTDFNMVPHATRSSVVSTFFALVCTQERAYAVAHNISPACVCPAASARPAAREADSHHPNWPFGQSSTEVTAAFTENVCPLSPPRSLQTSLPLGNGTAPSLTNATRTVQAITLTISVGQTTILDLAMPVLLVVLLFGASLLQDLTTRKVRHGKTRGVELLDDSNDMDQLIFNMTCWFIWTLVKFVCRCVLAPLRLVSLLCWVLGWCALYHVVVVTGLVGACVMPWTSEDPLQFTFRRAQRLASLNFSELLYECGMFIEHCPNFDFWDDGSDYACMADDTDWDAKKYPACAPYHGKRGTRFEQFVRDFGASMAEKGDEDASLYDTMLGIDPGGDDPAAPAAGNAAAVRRRVRRLAQLYSHIYRHVPEPRLREMMDAAARNDGRAAFQMLVANCRQQIDDLELLSMNSEFDNATILKNVGYNLDSITNFARYLNGLNAQRPIAQRKTEDDLTVKLLACLTSGIEATLAHEAAKELRADPGNRQFQVAAVAPVAGPPAIPGVPAHRDFQSAVTFFDDLWRTKFRSGDIKARPRGAAGGERNALADVHLADDDDDAMVVGGFKRGPPISRAELARETICWVCRGFGHLASDCPSKPGFRSITDTIAILSNSMNRSNKGRGRGRGRGRGGRGQTNVNIVLGEGFYTDEDGNVYGPDGQQVGVCEQPSATPGDQGAEPAGEQPTAGASDSGLAIDADWADEEDEHSASVDVIFDTIGDHDLAEVGGDFDLGEAEAWADGVWADDASTDQEDTDGCTEAARERRGFEPPRWSSRPDPPFVTTEENEPCACAVCKSRGMRCIHPPKHNSTMCEFCSEDCTYSNGVCTACLCTCAACTDGRHRDCATGCDNMPNRTVTCNCACTACGGWYDFPAIKSGELKDPDPIVHETLRTWCGWVRENHTFGGSTIKLQVVDQLETEYFKSEVTEPYFEEAEKNGASFFKKSTFGRFFGSPNHVPSRHLFGDLLDIAKGEAATRERWTEPAAPDDMPYFDLPALRGTLPACCTRVLSEHDRRHRDMGVPLSRATGPYRHEIVTTSDDESELSPCHEDESAPWPLEAGLEMGANAGEVMADVAGRNMAAFIAGAEAKANTRDLVNELAAKANTRDLVNELAVEAAGGYAPTGWNLPTEQSAAEASDVCDACLMPPICMPCRLDVRETRRVEICGTKYWADSGTKYWTDICGPLPIPAVNLTDTGATMEAAPNETLWDNWNLLLQLLREVMWRTLVLLCSPCIGVIIACAAFCSNCITLVKVKATVA